MSDPATSGYECHGPMIPIDLPEIGEGTAAFLCHTCLKWRHALAPQSPLRARVVNIMQPMTMALYRERQVMYGE